VDNWSRHSQLIEPDFTLTGTKVVTFPLKTTAGQTQQVVGKLIWHDKAHWSVRLGQ
jgi:hypothetical protein